MGNSTPLPSDDARMVAWREYTATDDYRNTKRWAVEPPHTEGSLWAAFLAGWSGATSRTPNKPDLTALAEACERAARALTAERPYVLARDYLAAQTLQRDINTLKDHARALREGRVTVNEGGDRARV